MCTFYQILTLYFNSLLLKKRKYYYGGVDLCVVPKRCIISVANESGSKSKMFNSVLFADAVWTVYAVYRVYSFSQAEFFLVVDFFLRSGSVCSSLRKLRRECSFQQYYVYHYVFHYRVYAHTGLLLYTFCILGTKKEVSQPFVFKRLYLKNIVDADVFCFVREIQRCRWSPVICHGVSF